MTIEEVIDRVKTAFAMWENEWDCGEDWSEEHIARDMAIKALKAQEKKPFDPFEDDIDEGSYYCGFTAGKRAAKNWIPCSECLPDYPKMMLVSLEGYVTGRISIDWYSKEDGWYEHRHHVKAWMPLPEPYKEKE